MKPLPLNEAQQKAVLHSEGPLLIMAGAGAGKTKTVTHRIERLVGAGVAPQNILAITFTNKAAGEMKERIGQMLGGGPSLPFVGTFHALGTHLLRQNADKAGVARYFVIFDQGETLSLIKKALKLHGYDPKYAEPSKVQNYISRKKNQLISVNDFRPESERSPMASIVGRIWPEYEKMKEEHKALDFDDIILKTVRLLQKNPEILAYYQSLWKYIHVDEYQDTNTAQYELVRLLAAGHRNLCVVGDADQNIYSWRGADFRNILNFEKDYPGATVAFLEQNYRSTQTIIEAANRIIKKNVERKDKKLFTENEPGEKIALYQANNEKDEATYLAERIIEVIDKGGDASEVAVLYRANFQSRLLEEALLRYNIPYQVLGTRFFERKEVKDVLGFLRFARNPSDTEALRRIINVPPRGIGDVTIEKIISGGKDALPARMREKYAHFETTIEQIREVLLTKNASEIITFVIKASGLENQYKAEKEQGEERLENLYELVTVASKFNHLSGEDAVDNLLSEAALVSDQDTLLQKKTGVRMMTVHASKGLEFKHVFIVGLEEGLFPHQGFDQGSDKRLEEERRLFYVAVTRAEKRLYLSYAIARTVFGQTKMNLPSQFIADIGDDLIEAEGRSTSWNESSHATDDEPEIEWDVFKKYSR